MKIWKCCHQSDQRCPWIGLDWIGSDDCYVQNYDALYMFQLNRPRLYYVIISAYILTYLIWLDR